MTFIYHLLYRNRGWLVLPIILIILVTGVNRVEIDTDYVLTRWTSTSSGPI